MNDPLPQNFARAVTMIQADREAVSLCEKTVTCRAAVKASEKGEGLRLGDYAMRIRLRPRVVKLSSAKAEAPKDPWSARRPEEFWTSNGANTAFEKLPRLPHS